MTTTLRSPRRCHPQRGATPTARMHRGRRPIKPRIPSPSGRFHSQLQLQRHRVGPRVAVAARVLHTVFESRKSCTAFEEYFPVGGRSAPAPAIRFRLLEGPNIVLGEVLSHSPIGAINAPICIGCLQNAWALAWTHDCSRQSAHVSVGGFSRARYQGRTQPFPQHAEAPWLCSASPAIRRRHLNRRRHPRPPEHAACRP